MGREKLPHIQFYTGDWLKDPAVNALTLEEQGAWVRLLCYMHESSERGYLVVNGIPVNDRILGQYLGCEEAKAKQIRSKLLEYGVASEDERGALYSRRMARDEEIREKRARAGRRGGKQNSSKSKANSPARADSDNDNDTDTDSETDTEVVPYQEIVDRWNATCGKKLPGVRALSSKRRRGIRSRVGQMEQVAGDDAYDPDWWDREIFQRILRSPFLTGDNDRGWTADFDFVFTRQDAALRILEGKYDDGRVVRGHSMYERM